MDLSNHFTTLQTSDRLNEMGMPQGKTLFAWVQRKDEEDYVLMSRVDITNSFALDEIEDIIDAYMASEVALQLQGFGDWITYINNDSSIAIRFVTRDNTNIDYSQAENEAEGRGFVLLALLDKGIIKHKKDVPE